MKCIIYFLLILPVFVFGQNLRPPLSTDRPDQTEAPDVVPRNYFQLETGVLLEKDKPEDNITVSTNNLATTLLRYGITETIELRLSGAYIQMSTQDKATISNDEGFAGINIGAKFHLFEQDGLVPQAGLIASVAFPFGNKIFIEDEIIPGILFAAAHTITDWFSVSYNLAARYRDNQNSFYRYSLALGFQPIKKIGIFGEIFGLVNKNNSPHHVIDFGMTYLVIPNLQLDTSYGFGVTDNTVDSFFNFGLSWRLPR